MSQQRCTVPLLVALGLLIVTGCRTYGGYGVQEKTYEAMQSTVQTFESELERARADLRRLEEAASQRQALASVVTRYEEIISRHESLLARQHQRLERLSAESDPRTLHNAYGATITERRNLRQKYQWAIKEVQSLVQGATQASAAAEPPARQYTSTPVGFPERETSGALTMAQALQGL